ncbi:AMP-binding protein [Candidatus Fermentibacteria bacterium]|nr:AMP-binding protein [Candidatus Fermentibacteria bacterium]
MLSENFVTTLGDSMRRNWQLPAFSNYGEDSITYAQVADRIVWFQRLLRDAGVKPGDKVAIVGRNSTNWALTYLATITYGAVIVPILSDFHSDDIHHIVNHSDSVLFLAGDVIFEKLDPERIPNVRGILSLVDFTVLHDRDGTLGNARAHATGHYLDDLGGALTPQNLSLAEVGNTDLAAIVYTSGTTGFSKGVMLPHNSLIANVKFAREHLPLGSGDPMVSFMPLAHSYGCAFEFLYPFSVGCHVTFLGRIPSPKVIIQAFQAIHPRLILAVPLILEKIYRKQLKPVIDKPTMKLLLKVPLVDGAIAGKICRKLSLVFGGNFEEMVIGGAALNPDVEAFLKRIKFPITVGYGMTEFGPLISYAGWKEHRPQSVGPVIDTLEVKIDSEDPRNVVGEICVRGENAMCGYYKNEEATAQAIDKDGWIHTGDLGIIDEDGFIYIKGRSKDMILGPSGQNIYPDEIEAKLNNMPYVQESLVLDKDGKLYALVYPDLEMVDSEKLSEADVKAKMEENRRALNQMLPAYSVVTRIDLYPEEFAKTPTKKIKRYLYRVPA